MSHPCRTLPASLTGLVPCHHDPCASGTIRAMSNPTRVLSPASFFARCVEYGTPPHLLTWLSDHVPTTATRGSAFCADYGVRDPIKVYVDEHSSPTGGKYALNVTRTLIGPPHVYGWFGSVEERATNYFGRGGPVSPPHREAVVRLHNPSAPGILINCDDAENNAARTNPAWKAMVYSPVTRDWRTMPPNMSFSIHADPLHDEIVALMQEAWMSVPLGSLGCSIESKAYKYLRRALTPHICSSSRFVELFGDDPSGPAVHTSAPPPRITANAVKTQRPHRQHSAPSGNKEVILTASPHGMSVSLDVGPDRMSLVGESENAELRDLLVLRTRDNLIEVLTGVAAALGTTVNELATSILERELARRVAGDSDDVTQFDLCVNFDMPILPSDGAEDRLERIQRIKRLIDQVVTGQGAVNVAVTDREVVLGNPSF